MNDLYDHAFIINLDRRTDRWEKASSYLKELGIEAERFSGYDRPLNGGFPNGNAGCTASHRALYEIIAYHKWPRVLIFEDDFLPLYDDVPERLESVVELIPADFDLLYLGGHYGTAPISRINEHVIRCDRMLTTSSYIITATHARRIAPYISGIGPIDNLVSGFAQDHLHCILQPRLFAQWTSKSDLCGETRENVTCMTDTYHENLV